MATCQWYDEPEPRHLSAIFGLVQRKRETTVNVADTQLIHALWAALPLPSMWEDRERAGSSYSWI